MLVLSRREGESVMIGTDVTIFILGVKGRQVRVGIAAPRSTSIYRSEILPNPQSARVSSAGSPTRQRSS